MDGIKKLFCSKDASLDISVGWGFRLLLGLSYGEARFNPEVMMRLFAIHLGPICFTFTSFQVNEDQNKKGPGPR